MHFSTLFLNLPLKKIEKGNGRDRQAEALHRSLAPGKSTRRCQRTPPGHHWWSSWSWPSSSSEHPPCSGCHRSCKKYTLCKDDFVGKSAIQDRTANRLLHNTYYNLAPRPCHVQHHSSLIHATYHMYLWHGMLKNRIVPLWSAWGSYWDKAFNKGI